MSMSGKPYAALSCEGSVDRAKQSMRDECDVNMIMAKFTKTGLISHLADGIPLFADVSEMGSYREAIENVRGVERYFAGLPAEVRSRFDNDTVQFMEYLETGSTVEDLEALGMAILGDRRSRPQDTREGDVKKAPPVKEGPSDTLPT